MQSVYARLNPHFIFNALSSIQGLINKNDIDGANKYLSEFGYSLTQPAKQFKKEFNSLESELDTLQNIFRWSNCVFQFNYQIQVDEHINTFDTTIPYLLLQPLLENAVKHGVAGMQENGNILLQINKQEDDMQVLISDNGNGFKQAE